jgi:RNA polymerase sigma factor (sigma-70 family)
MEDMPSAELLARCRDGDRRAENELFRRYTERLVGLARSQLSPLLASRLDPEDVVQSAYRSFFAGARDNRYVHLRSGDLWRLLVSITLHKLYHKVELNTADRRDVHHEQQFPDADRLFDLRPHLQDQNPRAEEAVALTDELEDVMRRLDPPRRRMLELRLQGFRLADIAAATQKCERTVRRNLDEIKRQLEQRL